MKREDRKAAIAAYKERKDVAGIYVIRCAASGQVWVGRSLSLDTVKNRVWFTLNIGSNPKASLQKAWSIHGRDSLVFEQLEARDEDEPAYLRNDFLKKRHAHWLAELAAETL